MALQIWLPLNGTTENKGFVGEITGSNITFTSGGKIGKCLSGGTLTLSPEQAAQVNNNKEVSIAFWTYINADTGTPAGGFAFYGKTDWEALDNRKFCLMQYPNVNTLHYSFENDGAGSTFLADVVSNALPSYKWTHVAVVYQNPNLRIYINGELAKTDSGVSNSSSFAYTVPIIASSQRYLQDFRVYNHALSVKEVKELSKGLVAHYKLTSRENARPNLLPITDPAKHGVGYLIRNNGGLVSVDNNVLFNGEPTIKITPSSSSVVSGAGNSYGSRVPLTAGKQYCYSCYIKSNIADTWNFNSLGQFQTTTGSVAHNSDVIYQDSKIPANEWVRVYQTFTVNADCKFVSYHTNFESTSQIINIAKIKLEEGDYPTPWCPCELDDNNEYEEWCYDNGIEYDVSGNGYDLVKVGSISYSSDSPKYSTCLNSVSGSYLKAKLDSDIWLPKDALTVNIWIKPTTSWAIPISCSERGGWNFDDGWGTGVMFSIRIESFGGTFVVATDVPVTSLIDGSWHMLTGTFSTSDQTVKIYVDGVLRGTQSTGTSNKLAYFSNKLIIGGEAAEGEIPSASDYTGGISDVRIYSTALSAADVQELYKNGASVGKDGKCYSYEFIEI